MKHRHLNSQPDRWGVAVIESIWERGSDKEILKLLRECKRDPFGPAANAVRKTIPHSKVYGYPKMFKLFLQNIEKKNAAKC